jgi:hypothetical protein
VLRGFSELRLGHNHLRGALPSSLDHLTDLRSAVVPVGSV